MQITILSVSIEKISTGKTPYEKAEVAYKDNEGQIKGKKVMSFVNPDVFEKLKNAQANEVYTISSAKDNNGYWQWTSFDKAEAGQVASAQSYSAPKTNSGNWPTAEERAQTQVYIIRQNALTNATSLAAVHGDKKVTPEAVIQIAKQFEAFVLDTKFDDGTLAGMSEDTEGII